MMQNKTGVDPDLIGLTDDIKKSLSSYIQKKLELYRLKTYEKIAVSGSFLGYSLILLLSIFTIMFLILITLGLCIGERLKDYAEGFGILILISVVMMFILILIRKRVRRFLTSLFVSIIEKIESNEQ